MAILCHIVIVFKLSLVRFYFKITSITGDDAGHNINLNISVSSLVCFFYFIVLRHLMTNSMKNIYFATV